MKTVLNLISVALVILLVFGYIRNIVKFVQCDFKPPLKAEIIRGIGIFVPYGCIVGLMTIEDK